MPTIQRQMTQLKIEETLARHEVYTNNQAIYGAYGQTIPAHALPHHGPLRMGEKGGMIKDWDAGLDKKQCVLYMILMMKRTFGSIVVSDYIGHLQKEYGLDDETAYDVILCLSNDELGEDASVKEIEMIHTSRVIREKMLTETKQREEMREYGKFRQHQNVNSISQPRVYGGTNALQASGAQSGVGQEAQGRAPQDGYSGSWVRSCAEAFGFVK